MTTPKSSKRRYRQYSPEFKAKMVAACQRPGTSVSSVAIANGINTNVVRRWLREHGDGKDWHDRDRSRTYTYRSEELKRTILAQCQQPGVTVKNIAAAHGVYPSLIGKWKKKFQPEQAMLSAASIPASSVDDWLPVVVTEEICPAKEPEPESSSSSLPKPSRSVLAPFPEPTPGQIDIELGGARLQLRGEVDLNALRVVIEALRR